MTPTGDAGGATSASSATDRTLERLRAELEANEPRPPFKEHHDYMLLPYSLAMSIRWLLTSSSSLPEQRVAAIDALDVALNSHRAHCANHQEPYL